LTFDLLTSKSNQFIVTHKCTKSVNLVEVPQVIYKISCTQTFGTDGWKDGQTITKHNASSTVPAAVEAYNCLA